MVLGIGALMGFFALFPGASLATIPFLLGFYDHLFWQKGKLASSLLLLLGFVLIVVLFSYLIQSLLALSSFRIYAYSFLTGIQLLGVRVLLKKIHYWNISLFLFLSIGLLLSAFALPKMTGSELFLLPHFWQGFIAAFSFLLPGFSVMNAIPFYFPSIFFYFSGFLLALPFISFFLFKRWKNQRERTLSFFLGLSIGSLPTIWPYSPFIHFIHQETIVSITNVQMVISFFCFLLGYFPLLKLLKVKSEVRSKK